MKYVFTLLFAIAIGCEPECKFDDFELSDLELALVEATSDGEVVVIDEITEGETEFNGAVGLLNVRETRNALATCPALGLPSPEYDWFCMHDDANGRIIAKDPAEPTLDDIQLYDEYPSVENPNPMTSRVFFNKDIYPKNWGGPWEAMRGIITSWGTGWSNARVDWCNHPVHQERCNQE